MKKLVLALVCLVMAQGAAAQAQDRDTEAYTLGPDDAVQIQVWQRADLSGTFNVDNQGNLTLPLLGEVHAEGMTPADLGRDLARRYAILDSGVSEVLVSIAQYNSRYLTIVGEVRSPGRYSFQTMPTIWDAILAAGGGSPQADLAAVEVVRREARPGEAKSVTVDLSKGLEKTPAGTLPVLRAGDSVILPAISLNVVTGDQVQVLGAVRTPGLYPLRAAGSVVAALSVSGGTIENAKLDDVRLARRTEGGVVVYGLDVRGYLYDGYPAADMALRPGDTVTVPSQRGGFRGVLHTAMNVAPLLSAVVSVWLLGRNLN
jgi:polysaccharide export outer membrane protein